MARGRPPKFGRPSTLLALTLPQDTIEFLQATDTDVGWAIVKLADRARGGESGETPEADVPPDAQLVPIGPNRYLIVVRDDAFADLPDVSLVPLGLGRAFLAFLPHKTVEGLELSLIDAIDDDGLDANRRRRYETFRALLKSWRQDATLSFHARSIIVVERDASPKKSRVSR